MKDLRSTCYNASTRGTYYHGAVSLSQALKGFCRSFTLQCEFQLTGNSLKAICTVNPLSPRKLSHVRPWQKDGGDEHKVKEEDEKTP